MTYEEIIKAVDEGKTVHWSNMNYIVVKADQSWGGYAIRCLSNGHMSALTYGNGIMAEKNPEKFFIGGLLFENESKLKH